MESYEPAEPGKPKFVFGQRMFMADLLESFAGLIPLGFHSKRNTGELLHHSYEFACYTNIRFEEELSFFSND